MVYTYILMTKAGLPTTFSYDPYNALTDDLVINEATTKLSNINKKIKSSIVSLIKKISKDNYNRQQLEKLKKSNNYTNF